MNDRDLIDKLHGCTVISNNHIATAKTNKGINMDREGKLTLEVWVKLTTGLVCAAAAIVWVSLGRTQDLANTTKQEVEVMKVHIKNILDTQAQHAALFTEIRGMIRNTDDLVRTTVGALNDVKTQQSQILDDLHWLKSEKYTKEQYEEFQARQQAKQSSSSANQAGRPNSNSSSPTP